MVFADLLKGLNLQNREGWVDKIYNGGLKKGFLTNQIRRTKESLSVTEGDVIFHFLLRRDVLDGHKDWHTVRRKGWYMCVRFVWVDK